MDTTPAGTTYEAALDYLYEFVNYERKMTERYAPEKMDPGRPLRLLQHLGNPHTAFPSIHIAGSKGKGSVAAMCASALAEAGLRVGLYTSPHLQDFRERIRVLTPEDRQGLIPPEALVSLVDEMKQVVPRVAGLTYFELITAIGFLYFARQQVDVAVVEVGLGGRLDATNVLTPLVSVITSLSLEHTALLGNTLAEIAAEKGGIIKPAVPVVSAPQDPEALTQLQEIAAARGAPLTVVGQDWQYVAGPPSPTPGLQTITITATPPSVFLAPAATFDVALMGAHQRENATVALAALYEARAYLPTLTEAAIRRGLRRVQWPGRLQMLHQAGGTPSLLLDGAHTAASAQRLAEALLHDYEYRHLWLIIGVTADKQIAGVLQPLLALTDGVFVTRADHPRASSVEALQAEAQALGYQVETRPDVASALVAAWEVAGPGDLICATGSMFVVGDLLNCWESLKSLLIERET